MHETAFSKCERVVACTPTTMLLTWIYSLTPQYCVQSDWWKMPSSYAVNFDKAWQAKFCGYTSTFWVTRRLQLTLSSWIMIFPCVESVAPEIPVKKVLLGITVVLHSYNNRTSSLLIYTGMGRTLLNIFGHNTEWRHVHIIFPRVLRAKRKWEYTSTFFSAVKLDLSAQYQVSYADHRHISRDSSPFELLEKSSM